MHLTHRALRVSNMAALAWEEECALDQQGSMGQLCGHPGLGGGVCTRPTGLSGQLYGHPGPGEVTSKACPSFWQNCKQHELRQRPFHH